MKNLSKFRSILDLAKEVESKETDKKLEEGVKKTTELLLEKRPDITYEDLLVNLLVSARESYKHMIESEEINSSVSMFMEMAKMIAESDEEELSGNEEFMLRYILKSQFVQNMLSKSFRVSVKAVTELWNGRNQRGS